jgi:alginate O-acetyltransferase complex protein AlgI
MVFSSHIFVFYFLPAALLTYYALLRRARHLALTLLSYVFYGWANPAFVVLMFVSTAVDYVAGIVQVGGWKAFEGGVAPELVKGGTRTRRQKVALIVSLCSNLSLLGFFKYFNFAVENVSGLMRFVGFPDRGWDEVFRVTLPLGISFYTFQSMSYSIDVYRGDARALRNFVDFACYVSMFPQLVAGPIIRFSEVADQLRNRTHTLEKFARGASFFALGMAKKILLANPCGKIADTIFDAGSVHALEAWYGVLAYAFQIYFDFSGYSDMAIGLGLMMGFVFPKNFDSPYRSESVTEFWRRWHISLSSWLRDYLYIPLGGNRKGERRTYLNLALTMLLGGLWHGAAWNFVIWGAIHGAMLAIERRRGKTSFYRSLPRVVRVGLTFLLVLISWVFFRASDLPGAMAYLGSMVGLGDVQDGAGLIEGLVYRPYYLLSMGISAIVVWSAPQTWDWTRRLSLAKMAVCLLLFWASLMLLATQSYNPFIYFIF